MASSSGLRRVSRGSSSRTDAQVADQTGNDQVSIHRMVVQTVDDAAGLHVVGHGIAEDVLPKAMSTLTTQEIMHQPEDLHQSWEEMGHPRLAYIALQGPTMLDNCLVRGNYRREDPKGEKTRFASITTPNGHKVEVTITSDVEAIGKWIDRQEESTVFGFDTEWTLDKFTGKEIPENSVAILQISSWTEVLLVQLLYLRRTPHALSQFLQDPALTFAGVATATDVRKLEVYGLKCGVVLDLAKLPPKLENGQQWGMKRLATTYLNMDVDKSHCYSCSNWAAPELNRKQIKYAALDAWVSLALYKKLVYDLHYI